MRIAIAGLGHVGAATVRLLQANAELLKMRGKEITVVAVNARGKGKKRECDLTGLEWVDDPLTLASRSDIDVVVEAIGGAEGIALELAKAAFANSKHFVSANKSLIAAHGVDLACQAEKAGLQLSFEAAVCGGIPILKALREGLAANHLSSVRGILNGTSNYILTHMADDQMDFDTALSQAQQKGYAEADPTDDIDGIDAANKLAILTALAFGTAPDISSIFVEGIRNITQKDLRDAAARGGRIKLLGIATRTPSGITQRVQPVFVPMNEMLASVSGADNGVEIVGDFVGDVFLQGKGAGGAATASSVVADLIDIARGNRNYAFGVPAEKIGAAAREENPMA